jgi:hypothetical protein
MTQPTLGALVLYTTACGTALPAVVVHTANTGTCNLQVFTNESLPNILHISDVAQTTEPQAGMFHLAADTAGDNPTSATIENTDIPTAKKGAK